jgi:GT2 family glycosyltransferase
MITLCLTYFKSLTLENLDAALYTVQQQDLSNVKEIVIIDNDTADSEVAILDVVESFGFPVPKRVLSFKHGDPTKTHAWSTNAAVREATTPWVFFTRADYLLAFDAVKKFYAVVQAQHYDHVVGWNGFVTANGCHLANVVEECDATHWREAGPQIFQGATFDYTVIDAGVWMARRDSVLKIEGLNEGLTAWGHAQTDFQHRLFKSGVEFVRIPETLFWHPFHGGSRDIDVAHAQLAAKGGNLKEMWARYEGVSPY